ncbi:DEAD/DEAH box helicase family protein [Macrococcus animalis]|uniref:DEAD/DEAH box helicase family protein n=1 Tax=Macrococcus animalis TaxID=3395467 RepID=UPI0039BDC98F
MRITVTEVESLYPAIKTEGQLSCQFCLNQNPHLFHRYYHHGYQEYITYCRSCITQSVHSKKYLHISSALSKVEEIVIHLPFTLTKQQQHASKFILEKIEQQQSCLLYAVTGAGKTEMILEGIVFVRRKGGNVAVVSPRTDVVKELSIRLTDYLQTDNIATLYGGHSEILSEQLIISTIHQLMYFKDHFDLIIIDEIDAFPVGHDPRLMKLLERALSDNGIFVYLSATPPKYILKQCEKNIVYLPLRYHERPLPVPKFQYLGHHQIVKKINSMLQRVTHQNIILIFFHDIQLMIRAYATLHDDLKVKVVCVDSSDIERHEKVEDIRNKKYQFVFTTTILERGFTMQDLYVWVFNSHLFKCDSLIQIAGRVDRKGNKKNGEVIFFHDGISLSMINAKKNIQKMNQRGAHVLQ